MMAGEEQISTQDSVIDYGIANSSRCRSSHESVVPVNDSVRGAEREPAEEPANALSAGAPVAQVTKPTTGTATIKLSCSGFGGHRDWPEPPRFPLPGCFQRSLRRPFAPRINRSLLRTQDKSPLEQPKVVARYETVDQPSEDPRLNNELRQWRTIIKRDYT